MILTCEKHGDYQFTERKFKGGKIISKHCPKCALEIQTEKDRSLYLELKKTKYRDAQLEFEHKIKQSGVMPVNFGRVLSDFTIGNEKDYENLNQVNQYLKTFNTPKSILAMGLSGSCKTLLFSMLITELVSQGANCLIKTFDRISLEIKSGFEKGGQDELDAIDSLIAKDLLIIDEFDVAKQSDFNHRLLFNIVNGRYNNMKPTVLISNLNNEEIKRTLDPRVYRRLKDQNGEFLTFS